jgi:hypothetical protein
MDSFALTHEMRLKIAAARVECAQYFWSQLLSLFGRRA